MNSKERLKKASRGEKTDRIPFLPTVFEHSAKLINKTPSEAAKDAEQIAKAQVKAYDVYGQDTVTVGIDVYNIEAESLGCTVKYHDDFSVPGISTHPMSKTINTKDISFSTDKGRIGIVLNAAEKVLNNIGDRVNVSTGISGPFSIVAELVGFDSLVFKCIEKPDEIHSLLKSVMQFQKRYCDEIIKRGLGVTVFESWATPPLISPDTYRKFVKPYEKQLISYIKSKGIKAVPLIIGGDTSAIVDDIIDTGTTLLLADFKVDLNSYIKKADKHNLLVRGNIDPKLVEKGTTDEILKSVKRIVKESDGYGRFVLGTGVIPYNTPTENILAIKRYLESI